jgi:hypothetical protein
MFLPNNKSAPTIYLSPANWTKRTLLRRQVHHRRPIARRRSSPTHLPRPARPSSCCKTATTRVPSCNASSLADDARDTHTPYTVYVRRSTRILHHPRMCCAAATTSQPYGNMLVQRLKNILQPPQLYRHFSCSGFSGNVNCDLPVWERANHRSAR